MSVQALRDSLKDYARDIRLNLGSVLTPEGAPGLTPNQIWGTALASAYQSKDERLVAAVLADAQDVLSAEEVEAAKAAATIMAMNTIYYRTMHLMEDKEPSKLPARLRMNVIGKPGISKLDFELYSLALAALAGCGACINAHVHEVKKAGLSDEAVQSAIRIAAVVNATAQALAIG